MLLAEAFENERHDPELTRRILLRWQCATTYPYSSLPTSSSKRAWWSASRPYPEQAALLYGLRVHLVVSGAGEPVEFALAAGSEADEGAQGLEPELARRFDHIGRQGLYRLRLRRPARRGWLTPKGPAQEELQAADARSCRLGAYPGVAGSS